MTILFYASGEFGLPTLTHLHQQRRVVGVVTQPDKPAGRHQRLTPTPIGEFAQQVGLPLFKPVDANDPQMIRQVRALQPQASVVIAFGQKLSEELIQASATNGCVVNLHASLLPKYRGAAPINWAILNGESVAGVSVISLAQRMDAGLVYATRQTPIGETETAGELHDRLAKLGPDAIDQVLADFASGRAVGAPQDESQTCRAPKLSKADGWVDFNRTAFMVSRRVHGLTPWPGVKVTWHSQATGKSQELFLRRVKPLVGVRAAGSSGSAGEIVEKTRGDIGGEIGGVAVSDGLVEILELQVPGGRPMTFSEFICGRPMRRGDRLVSQPPVQSQPG